MTLIYVVRPRNAGWVVVCDSNQTFASFVTREAALDHAVRLATLGRSLGQTGEVRVDHEDGPLHFLATPK